jgi:peptide deformylase
VPGFYESVIRSERIRVRALDREGQPLELDAEGLLAVCISTRWTTSRASYSWTTCRS